jgi:hypothetical protein
VILKESGRKWKVWEKNTKQRFRSRNKKTTPIEFSWIEKMGFRKRLQI